ncbi:hypothetical protein JOD63_003325 [Microbacterium terrae]|uniref:STAS/SEC14 domain-containing protein n=1 Tax=Microbacterium terrae TaxID=69369 RepID=A0A0M2HFJ5_9MICO|nr:STAS/SEC14 domain-containing protein [Microbacterium terrae]KJL43033.1 hypothetical protein RS81_00997 [Microbacterium terrae]MBP1079357.1 hypothetical protein [Microbacterium terrae]GLJ98757.1 hypothetical protein GCM10017594_19540 [Microbacterium terrae]
MLTEIPDLPSGAVGFRVGGEVTVDEYRDVVETRIAEAARAGGPIDVVAVIDDVAGFEPGVALRDAALGLRDRHEWGRLAIVSDHEGLAFAVGMLTAFTRLDVRVFAAADEAAAIAWISHTV